MVAIPESPNDTVVRIYKAYEEANDDTPRGHLGASQIGHECERNLWLSFRWATRKSPSGRLLRLFETGNLAEARFTANLRAIGVEVHDVDPDGKQWKVSFFGGHFSGSMDGAGLGVPEAPKTWHVLEYKTHSEKSFKDLCSKGLEKSKPMHYAQTQVYMGGTGMDRALYLAVNKNTDELFSTRAKFDKGEFLRLTDRALRIITSTEPPPRISNDPSWYVCNMCDFKGVCHLGSVPEPTCRSCVHSSPELDGDSRWSCAQHKIHALTKDQQLAGCTSHRFIPILLERLYGTDVDVSGGDVVYQTPTGQVVNGQSLPGALTSVELHKMESPLMAADVCRLKAEVSAQGISSTVVG